MLAGKLCADTLARHTDVTEALGLSADPATATIESRAHLSGQRPGQLHRDRACAVGRLYDPSTAFAPVEARLAED